MERRIVLVDCDDVLLQWTKGFQLFFEHKHKRKLDPNGPASYDLSSWTGLIQEEVFKELKEFNEHSWEFGCLPPVESAVSAIRNLHSMYMVDFVSISSCSTKSQTVALRHANLYHVFGDVFKHVHCVDLRTGKATHLADYRPTFWVEDNVDNAMMGLEYGHKSIVLKTSQNIALQKESDKRLIWCDTWKEIEEIIAANN